MTEEEIESEIGIEWLEGIARYAEYILSEGSKSLIARNLDKISKKAGDIG